MNFIPAISPTSAPTEPVAILLFTANGQIVLNADHSLPRQFPDKKAVYLGRWDEQPCFVKRLTDEPNDFQCMEIRGLYSVVTDELYALIGFASQILTWRENHRFCSRCGTRAEPSATERAMVCPACGYHNYPRISPSIIVAITRGDELLMARSPHFPEGLYSVLAGFVEPGETLEQGVAREVREESGLEISNIQYHSSQPWPFPHSIMIAFTADYAAGELNIDPNEIEDAGWYTPDTMPETIPSRASIARTLIEDYLAAHS